MADHNGGIWYQCREDLTSIWNYVDYHGEKMWEVPRIFEGPGLPEPSDGAEILGTWGDMGLFYDYLNSQRHVFAARNDGSLIQRNDDQIFAVFPYPGTQFIPRARGDFILKWSIDANRGRRRGILVYDPANHSFPWGSEGYQISWGEYGNGVHSTGATCELPNGDVITCCGETNSSSLFRFFSNGNVQWNREINDILPEAIIPNGDDGFWIWGYSNWYNRAGGTNRFNYYDREGRPAVEGFIDIGTQERLDPQLPLHWIDEDGQYRCLFSQPWIGYTMTTMNPQGGIVGEYNGTVVLPDRNQGRYPRFSFRVNGVNIFFESWLHAKAFNDEGELLWDQQYDIGEWTSSVPEYAAFVSPDSQSLFIMTTLYNVNGVREEVGFTAKFRVANGELEWRYITPAVYPIPIVSGMVTFAVSSDAVYHVLDWSADSGAVWAADYDGQPLWESPYIFPRDPVNSNIFGAAPADDGGFWIGFMEQSDEGLDCYLQKFEREGGFTRRVYPYAEPWRGEYEWDGYTPPYQLLTSLDNIWIIPTQHIEFGVQCLTQAGERLMPPYGCNPEFYLIVSDGDYLKYAPDSRGGVWIACRSRRSGLWVFHFTPEGLSPGWNPLGELISDLGWWDELKEVASTPSGDFLLVWTRENEGINAAADDNYYFQHVSDDSPGKAEPDQFSAPVAFEFLSAFPQPFNSRLSVVYQATGYTAITLKIYDLTGRTVAERVFSDRDRGRHSIILDASDWRSGVYFLTMDDGQNRFTRKVVLLR